MKKSKEYRKNKISREKQNQIEKRYKLLIILIIISIATLIGYLFYVQIIQNKYFKEKVEEATIKIVEGDSAPRGRIYDRLGRLRAEMQRLTGAHLPVVQSPQSCRTRVDRGRIAAYGRDMP